MTAEDRAEVLMNTTRNQLPALADKYLLYFSKQVGGCGEVYFTAFAAYAQAVEGLKPASKSYEITKEAKEWFKKNA